MRIPIVLVTAVLVIFSGISQASTVQSEDLGAKLSPATDGGETDLAVTDIFLDRRKDGRLWVRITNHGPNPIRNRAGELIVVVDGGALLVGCKLTVAPGQTQATNTGMIVDGSQKTRDVTVTVRVPGMKDVKPGNNTYRERVP